MNRDRVGINVPVVLLAFVIIGAIGIWGAAFSSQVAIGLSIGLVGGLAGYCVGYVHADLKHDLLWRIAGEMARGKR